MSNLTRRMVHFFEEAGAENTEHVLKAVKQRIRQEDVDKVLVASESGRLALRVRDAVPPPVSVICVAYNRQTRTRYQKPSLMKQRLQKAGVAIVDTVREPMGRRLVFRNWFERKTLQARARYVTSSNIGTKRLDPLGRHARSLTRWARVQIVLSFPRRLGIGASLRVAPALGLNSQVINWRSNRAGRHRPDLQETLR